MVYLGSLKIGAIFGLSAEFLKEYDVFNLGKKTTSKIFLQKLLKLDESTSFKDVEREYRKSNSGSEIPKDEHKFWDFIAKEYLNLETEPRDEFLKVSFKVSADLSMIAANLKCISDERKALKDKNHLSADERYYRNQLDYFENKNLVARNEIVDFMADGIKGYAIREASSSSKVVGSSAFFFNRGPYAFGHPFLRSLGDPYDFNSLNEHSNKFMDLTFDSYEKIMDTLREKPELIKEFSLDYINGVPNVLLSVKEKINKFVAASHLLDRRKQVIHTIFNHFEAKDYISFVSIVPLQIEGIFADICKEIGISENQLDISSLNDKLQHIDGKINSFFFFEYYSFKFPVLRNQIAHGGLIDGEFEDVAIKLMLDFLPVCELAVSEELPINHARKVIKLASGKDYGKLIEWLDLRDKVSIPDFYGMQEMITSAEAFYSTQEFWNYLVKELKSLKNEDEVKECVPVKVAKKLKSKGFAQERCEAFLKNAKNVVQESIQTRKKIQKEIKSFLKPELNDKKKAC